MDQVEDIILEETALEKITQKLENEADILKVNKKLEIADKFKWHLKNFS